MTYPLAPGLLDATVIFAQAAAEAGVRSVVSMSQVSARREAASNAARQHWLAERLLDRSRASPANEAAVSDPRPCRNWDPAADRK